MNTIDLKNIWLKITSDGAAEWTKIEAAYSDTGRYYHTLRHLCDVYVHLDEYYEGDIPLSTLYALFYHDFIYNTLRSDNEKLSADRAHDILDTWDVDRIIIDKTASIILATASHESTDAETMTFLDADMAILGSDEQTYQDYTDKVRKEFSIYPDLLYHRGRKKFVASTLKRDYIFLTDAFRSKYEDQARINLTHELNLLS